MENLLKDPFFKLFFQQIFYVVVGIIITGIFYLLLKKKFLGGFWIAVGIGIIGAFLGSYFLNEIIKFLVHYPFGINSIATIIGSIILLWIYSVVSKTSLDNK